MNYYLVYLPTMNIIFVSDDREAVASEFSSLDERGLFVGNYEIMDSEEFVTYVRARG